MIPNELTLAAMQAAFRDLSQKIDALTVRNVDLNGRRVINAGKAVQPFDYVRKIEVEELVGQAQPQTVTETTTVVQGLLNAASTIRRGLYADRGPAAAHQDTLYLATDRDYIGFYSTGAIWVYAFGLHRAAIADRPTPTSDEANYPFYATDTFVLYFWDGAAWVEDILSTIERFGGLTSSFPALKRSSAILQARLADDSAHTDIEVLDEAYDPTNWNASLEVPTKNAVRDKIETVTGGETGALVSDTAYDAGSWNGVTGIAPSKNAVRDKVETLLSQNGVNFGPAAVASITVVNGQITAIS